ncbi:MAG: hypothetical protein Q8S55_21515 [Methylococcaceae bacterium]|nr:hypothetical protein [Methylococcaceae bacterium]
MNSPMKELAKLPKDRRDLIIRMAAKKAAEIIMNKKMEAFNSQQSAQ